MEFEVFYKNIFHILHPLLSIYVRYHAVDSLLALPFLFLLPAVLLLPLFSHFIPLFHQFRAWLLGYLSITFIYQMQTCLILCTI